MGSRIAATLVLVAGVAVLLWVMLRSDTKAAAPIAAAPASETPDPAEAAGADSPTAAEPATVDESAVEDAAPPPATATQAPAIDEPENFGPRRSLVALDGWLNTDITSLDDLDGQVVMVEMWTFGCHNCKARIPFNQSYYEEFRDQGFEIVGVHAPEFSYEADVANIEQALVDLGVTWPVALDTNKRNFHLWQDGTTGYWPRTYLIDQNGNIRYDHIGEGRYEELREVIRYLLDNPPPAPST